MHRPLCLRAAGDLEQADSVISFCAHSPLTLTSTSSKRAFNSLKETPYQVMTAIRVSAAVPQPRLHEGDAFSWGPMQQRAHQVPHAAWVRSIQRQIRACVSYCVRGSIRKAVQV